MKAKLVAFVLFAAYLPAAQFVVTLNPTALNNETRTIDLQFNPGAFPSEYEPGIGTISAFNLGAGALGSVASGPDGGTSRMLPGPLLLVNLDFLNGIVYNAIFGTAASFLVDFSGNAYTASGQSILTTLSVSLNGAGIIVAVADLLGNRQPGTSFSSSGVEFALVPEPSTFGLTAMGIVLAVRFVRPRSN